ncbi:hypothetical protein ABWK46_03410 [Peribacillus frigoritolerans]|uniref:hypothetical protein n=1 Tax=Peribacillus frigoritolerans TaxID=450367 RepID=UPI0033956727
MVSILTRFDHGIITMILKQDMVYSMICFAGDETSNGLKKFATLLANNQLAKTMLAACFDIIEFVYSLMACCRQKKFHLNVKTRLIGAEGTLLREKRVKVRPRRRRHRGRTARGNQPSYISSKKL